MMQQPQNPLASAQPQNSVEGALSAMQSSQDQAKALFQQTGKAMTHIQLMNQQLASLAKLGDTVTPEDVIKSAGDMVASGSFSPNEAASILSDMPTNGAGIAQWVSGHLQQNEQVMEQVAKQHAIAQHEVGASALRTLVAHHQLGLDSGQPGAATPTPAPAEGSNPLSPGGQNG